MDLRTLTDAGSLSSDAARRVKAQFPEDDVVFATAATAIETAAGPPLKRSLKRFAQIRCNVVITDRRVVVQSSFRSLFTVIWFGMLGWGILGYTWYDRWYGLLLVPLALGMLVQRRPFRRVVALEGIGAVETDTVGSLLGLQADVVALTSGGKTLHIVPSARVSEGVIELLRTGKAAEE